MNLQKKLEIEEYNLPIAKDLMITPPIKSKQLDKQVTQFENTRHKTYYRLINESRKKRELFFNNIDDSLQVNIIRRPAVKEPEINKIKQNGQNLIKELSRKHLWRK
ncbi:hypothetical protein SS50377_24682 [Spironucleus salmonicida]|uniref:Uncharacterized protein n=1 Tax=Spironucleus salmonicida TaxID=348837 RepID=A0A9P8RXF7_9EUKA|nr:hypothetical protein SS50377_24682 [Spironucleus salmonicida]